MKTVEYIWTDYINKFRSKCRVLPIDYQPTLTDIPNWNYDGSSTGQASGKESEVIIKPRFLFIDPFRPNGYMVICDTYDQHGNPLENNHRFKAEIIFQSTNLYQPWFGLEQEYFLVDPETSRPLGFPKHGQPRPQGPYYCGVGTHAVYGRDIVEEHLQACLKSGIKISGINAEVAPGQWEFQVGPCLGIEGGDHLMAARYLLERVAEQHGVYVDYSPKPIENADINGSGCHINFSTLEMREGSGDKDGIEFIKQAIKKLETKHNEHMLVYGNDNHKRLTGKHETARYDEFTSGWGNRGASIRIGSDTIANRKGYFEDRRPASNIDPYLATSKLFETCCL